MTRYAGQSCSSREVFRSRGLQHLECEGNVRQDRRQAGPVACGDALEHEAAAGRPAGGRGPPALGHPRGDLGRQLRVAQHALDARHIVLGLRRLTHRPLHAPRQVEHMRQCQPHQSWRHLQISFLQLHAFPAWESYVHCSYMYTAVQNLRVSARLRKGCKRASAALSNRLSAE